MGAMLGHLLVVDDNVVNRKVLARALEVQGHTVATASNGQQALARLREQADPPFDLVLLDVIMPELDGYHTLAQIKADDELRHLPVIMVSALDELDSVIRCVELGAEDYLSKPFDQTLLRARIGACLEKKRLHDQEREYLRQVERLTRAAVAVEGNTFDPEGLVEVAERQDALGNLARVFQRMAREVHAREQRLRRQLAQLRLDHEERREAGAETVAAYLPMDRRQALARGATLPPRSSGAALFADISGFTPLAAALSRELGLRRGAEELIRQLNHVLAPLIDAVHRHGGSVVGFSGDAITCWFDGDDGERGVACALALQALMATLSTIVTPSGATLLLAIKVAVAVGAARRFVVGDDRVQLIDVLAGRPLLAVARGEQLAARGEILVESGIAAHLAARLTIAAWRDDAESGLRFAVVTGLRGAALPQPWPELPAGGLGAAMARPWLLPSIFARVRDGKSEFLAELRPAASLFLDFRSIDFDRDEGAAAKLDAFVRWVQATLARFDAALLQVTIGDKGSNLFAAFGAPVAHEDDAARAAAAALALQSPPADLAFITEISIGVAFGQMRAGASGSAAYRSYSVQGEKTNLAARLMQAARGGILCDEGLYQSARGALDFAPLPPIAVKGYAEPVPIYRPLAPATERAVGGEIDLLAPTLQLTLKVASVLGPSFPDDLLREIHPIAADRADLDTQLADLASADLLRLQRSPDGALLCAFRDAPTREVAYNLLLFAHRRQLHRAVAEWYERRHAADLASVAAMLAHHWDRADEASKALHYLEQAGEHARQRGAYNEAARYLQDALALDARASVVSAEYRPEPEGDSHRER